MHIFEALGLSFLIITGIGVGFLLAAYEKRRCRQAAGFLALLRHIRVQIECFSLPVPKILALCDERVRRDCGVPTGVEDFSALLSATRLCVPEAVASLLFDFAGQLGGCFREEQLRSCEYYLARLEELCKEMEEELPRRLRLSFLLPVSLTGIVVLTLI